MTMKILSSTFLLMFCFVVAAQDSPLLENNPEKTSINFFSMNASHLPEVELPKVQLKLPELTAQNAFQNTDLWMMVTHEFPNFCIAGNDQANGFLAFRTIKHFKLGKTRVTNTLTFDQMGNLQQSELIFGGN